MIPDGVYAEPNQEERGWHAGSRAHNSAGIPSAVSAPWFLSNAT